MLQDFASKCFLPLVIIIIIIFISQLPERPFDVDDWVTRIWHLACEKSCASNYQRFFGRYSWVLA